MTPRADDAGVTSDVRDLREHTSVPNWQRMEEELLRYAKATLEEAEGAKQASKEVAKVAKDAKSPRRWGTKRGLGGWRQWTAAAAGIVLAAAITFYLQPTRHDVVIGKPAVPPSATKPPAPTGVAPQRGVPSPPSSPAKPVRRQRTTAFRQELTSILDNFVALPGAAGLPPFESGRIVRMEVPVTALPAYGMDVVPDAAPGAVQADFLIGQDGVARAIRLAASSQR